MLANWYFCCCIDATPDKMVAFLSTLETLANPESDSVLLQMALAELDRADSWMQWYVVPQILNITHHPSANDSVRQAVHHCLGETLRKLPREIIPEYEEVLELCLNRSSPSDLLSKLSKLTTDLAIHPLHEGLKPSDQPYLDLHEFAPQNVLLAIMCDCLCPTSGATADIRTYLNSRRGDGALNDLLDQALDGRLGRLALRLAATIKQRAFSKPEALSNLANRVLSTPQANLAFEPDLMRTLAEILFEGQPATELLNETVALVNLPPLLEHIQPLSTLGLDVPKDRRQALEISLWQATLWDLAAESDPEGLAESIIDKWRMRDTSRPLPPQLFVSAANNDPSGWLTRLKSFWHAIALETEPPLPLQVGRGSYRPPSSLILRLLSSPLLPIQTMSFMGQRPLDGLGRYPTADQPVAQLRLWSGAVTAVRLLQKIPEDHPARPILAQVIAQTADSLNLLYGTTPGNDWLKNYDKPDIFYKIKRRLTFPLTGLALFIGRQVNLAVRGKLPSIAPRLFVDLLHENWLPENFRRYVLPLLLMRWIGDAYLGAIPERPTSRWLDLIDEVNDSFDYVFYRDRPNTVSVTEWAALVVRFLCRDAWDPGAISYLDWRNAREVKRSYKPPLEVPAQWHVSARRLLLTRELTPDDWLPPWEEPTLDSGRRLVRALERLASLQRGQATGSEVTAKWRKDFLDGINGILKHADLDRFARLRLVEFVDDPVLADDADGQELIGLALLEHGSPYELYGLLRRLYMGSVNASSARRQVQERLIPAILQTAVENLTEQKVLLNPRDPRLARDELDKAEMLRDFVLLLAHQGATTSHPEWLRHLAEWQETRRTAQADSSLRRRQVDVEILNARKRLLLERGEVPAWAIHAISYDPNQLVVALFYHDLDIPPDTTVLFGRREREIREFLSGPFDALSYVLAVVANATQEPDRSQYPYRYKFNIGAWFQLNFGYKHE